MSFHEIQFPTNISYGSSGGIGFSTTIVGLDGGAEKRSTRWDNARRKYNVAYGVKTHQDLADVLEFYQSMKGSAYGFRFKDWTDFTTAPDGRSAPYFSNVLIDHNTTGSVIPDFSTTLKKTYSLPLLTADPFTEGATQTNTTTRYIYKPIEGTVVLGYSIGDQGIVQMNASSFECDYASGTVTINSHVTDGKLWAGCEFDVPVRFTKSMDDLLSVSIDSYELGNSDSIELMEIFDSNNPPDDYFYGGGAQILWASGNISISKADGKALELYLPIGSADVTLPNPQFEEVGGPHFYITNSGNGVVTLIDLGSHGGTSFALDHEMQTGDAVTIWNSEYEDGSHRWRVWEST